MASMLAQISQVSPGYGYSGRLGAQQKGDAKRLANSVQVFGLESIVSVVDEWDGTKLKLEDPAAGSGTPQRYDTTLREIQKLSRQGVAHMPSPELQDRVRGLGAMLRQQELDAQATVQEREARRALGCVEEPVDSDVRKFDLVIYGATGYTGCLIVEHLDALLSDPGSRYKRGKLHWAIAGRNKGKLATIAKNCKNKPRVLHVGGSAKEIEAMVGDCKVILAAVGPFIKYGEAVVAACVNKKTHYVDVTGEPHFVHYMAEKYHAKAKEAGVMIVHMAGQLVSPNDVSCHKLVQKLGPLKQYREYFFQYGFSSGGSHATGTAQLEAMTKELHEVLVDPFSCGGHRRCAIRPEDQDCTAAEADKLYPSLWLQPGYCSVSASRMLRRSCELFEEAPAMGLEYGQELSVFIRDANNTQAAAEGACRASPPPPPPEMAGMLVPHMQEQVKSGEAAKPGDGPPEATRALLGTEAFALAEGESGEWAYVYYKGPEAYEATAMCSLTGALVLLEEIGKIKRGGVLTPAYAFHGSTWADRLQARGFGNTDHCCLSWTLHDGRPTEDELKAAMQRKMKKSMEGLKKLQKGEMTQYATPLLALTGGDA
mmetsp:Transcript_111372/g.315281  ORF Transcript_111372/g.315281 Transcript_111372/m.315281 type:complete len:597 (+) Transcript_111372:111-1901(+)